MKAENGKDIMIQTRTARTKSLIFTLPVLCLMLLTPLAAEVGIKGGVGLSGLLSDTGDYRHVLGYEMDSLQGGLLTGFQAGVFKAFSLSPRLQVQPEVFYALRGGDASQSFLYDDIVFKIMIYYLEMSVILRYKFGSGGPFSPVLFAGPYAALKLRAEKQTIIWNTAEVIPLENVKKTDYGFLLGLGGEYDIAPGHALVELRFSMGLKNMMAALPGVVPLYPEGDFVRNLNLSFMMGYAF